MVERGSKVKAGEVIALVDVRAASIEAMEARAQAANARTQSEAAKADALDTR